MSENEVREKMIKNLPTAKAVNTSPKEMKGDDYHDMSEKLAKTIDDNAKLIITVKDRLEIVLKPVPMSSDDVCESMGYDEYSDLTRKQAILTDRVETNNEILRSIVERLEI